MLVSLKFETSNWMILVFCLGLLILQPVSADHIVDFNSLGVYDGDTFSFEISKYYSYQNGATSNSSGYFGLSAGGIFMVEVLNSTPNAYNIMGPGSPTHSNILVNLSSGDEFNEQRMELEITSLISTVNASNIEEKLVFLSEKEDTADSITSTFSFEFSKNETTIVYSMFSSHRQDGIDALITSNRTEHITRDRSTGTVLNWYFLYVTSFDPYDPDANKELDIEEQELKLDSYILSDRPDEDTSQTDTSQNTMNTGVISIGLLTVFLIRKRTSLNNSNLK